MKKISKRLKKEEGFTLIETTIVLLVIALLSLLILPNIGRVNENVNSSTKDAIVATVDTQKELYKANNPEKGEPTGEELREAGYITEHQLKAYNAPETENE